MQILNNATTIPDSIDWCFHRLTEVGKYKLWMPRGIFWIILYKLIMHKYFQLLKSVSCAMVLNKSISKNKDIGFHFMKKKHKKKKCFQMLRAYNLNGKKTKYNISCHEEPELYFAPWVIFQRFHSKMELSFACCAVRECKSFLQSKQEKTEAAFNFISQS